MHLDASAAIVISDWVLVSRVTLRTTTVSMRDWLCEMQNTAPDGVVLMVASCTGNGR